MMQPERVQLRGEPNRKYQVHKSKTTLGQVSANFSVKGQMVTILGLLVTYFLYFYKPKKVKAILRPHLPRLYKGRLQSGFGW